VVPASGSAKAEARCQAGRAVTEAFATVRFGAQSFEQRSSQPRFEESLDVARRLELVGPLFVRPSPRRTGLGILDAAGRADQHGPADGQVRLREHMERHARAQRIPDERTRFVANRITDCSGDELGARAEVGPHGIGARVPGEIDGDERVRIGQRFTEATPEPARLGETVQQSHGWPGAPQFDLEGHGG